MVHVHSAKLSSSLEPSLLRLSQIKILEKVQLEKYRFSSTDMTVTKTDLLDIPGLDFADLLERNIRHELIVK